MTANFSIPVRSWLYMESFRFPLIGRLFHALTPAKIYSDLAINIVGYKDLVLTNEIRIGKDFKDKPIYQAIALLSYVKNKISDSPNTAYADIVRSIEISLSALEEIKEAVNKKKDYQQMKREMFVRSSAAITSNINKYR